MGPCDVDAAVGVGVGCGGDEVVLCFVSMGSRFVLPPHLTLKNFEGLDLGHMEKVRRSAENL